MRWLGEVGARLKNFDGLGEVVMIRWRSGGWIYYIN